MTHESKARLLGAIGSWIMRALLVTLRFRFTDHARIMATPPEKPLLWAFWHNRLFAMPYVFEHFFPGRPGAALTSASKDGEILAAFLNRFSVRAIRGSSSRGGARALVEMKRAIEDGYIMGITPDGPRGPAREVKEGAVRVAQLAGMPIVPIANALSRKLEVAKSWDRLQVPLPFGRSVVIYGEPIRVGENDDLAAKAAELKVVLDALTDEADRLVS